MKLLNKIVSLVIISIIALSLVACSNTDTEEQNSEEEYVAELTDKEINIINENLKVFTEGTAFDGATYEIELDKKDLKVYVVKPITDIMTAFKTTNADDTVEAIKKSLVFDTAYEVILEETDLDISCMQVFVYGSDEELKNNEYYTIKTIM